MGQVPGDVDRGAKASVPASSLVKVKAVSCGRASPTKKPPAKHIKLMAQVLEPAVLMESLEPNLSLTEQSKSTSPGPNSMIPAKSARRNLLRTS